MGPTQSVTYDFNGVRHVQQGHRFRVITGEEFEVFQQLQRLEMEQDWPAVVEICEAEIEKTPEWLTPYLCCGVAHANLGHTEAAIHRLELVERESGGNPLYSAASRILMQLRMEEPKADPKSQPVN